MFSRKASDARIGLSVRQTGQAVQSPINYESFSRQGYQKNVTVYRCVSMIAQACAGIELELYQKRAGGKPIEIENHELLNLIKNPNPIDSGYQFMESLVSYFLLTGNGLIEQTKLSGNRIYSDKQPIELWTVRPDRIKIIVGKNGYPKQYELTTNDVSKVWEFDEIKLKSNLIHMKSFNPTDLWWGMSPLQAAMLSLDQSNAADKWNLSLLQNSATPSGVLKVLTTAANPTGTLGEAQFANLKSELELNYQGAQNTGRPMLLEGGLDWTQISLSPKEMSFLENKKVTSADIAEVFGVPLEMLGLGQKTFNNYAEARAAFYEETVLPLLDSILNKFNNCIAPSFGQGLYLKYDKDDIEALGNKRQIKFNTVKDANFLTQNEKRTAAGYEEKIGWDVFVIGNQILGQPDDLTAQDIPTATEPETTKSIAVDDLDDEKSLGWKSINLINSNEKKRSWRKQNNQRDRLAKSFERDLNSDFKKMNDDILDVLLTTKEKPLIDLRINQIIEKSMNEMSKTVAKNIKYTVEDFSQNLFANAKSIGIITIEKKTSRNYNDWVERFVKKRTADAITAIDGTTRKKASALIKDFVSEASLEGESNTDLANVLMDNFKTISKGRAHTIARTEVSMASNNANLNAARDLEVPNLQKEWISANDDRSRDGDKGTADHVVMDGVQVPMDEMFSVPPDAAMDGPSDISAPAEQVINCRCVLVFSAR
jgi:HK97 family phage portal protein